MPTRRSLQVPVGKFTSQHDCVALPPGVLKGRDNKAQGETLGSVDNDSEPCEGETDEDAMDSVTLAALRLEELESGKVIALTEEEFWRGIRVDRETFQRQRAQ